MTRITWKPWESERKVEFSPFVHEGPNLRLIYAEREIVDLTRDAPRIGDSFWAVQLLNENAPLEQATRYIFKLPKDRRSKMWELSAQAIAESATEMLNEKRGFVVLQLYADGIVTFSASFIANSRQVLCMHTTDPSAAKIVNPFPVTAVRGPRRKRASWKRWRVSMAPSRLAKLARRRSLREVLRSYPRRNDPLESPDFRDTRFIKRGHGLLA